MATFEAIQDTIYSKIRSIDTASFIPTWSHQFGGDASLLKSEIDTKWPVINTGYTWSSALGDAWFRSKLDIPSVVEGIELDSTKLSFEFIMPIGAAFYVDGAKRYYEPSWADSRAIPLVISEKLQAGKPLDLAICANKGDGFGLLLSTRLYFHVLEELRFKLQLVVAQFQFAQYIAGDCADKLQIIDGALSALDADALAANNWGVWWESAQTAVAKLMPLNDTAKQHTIHLVAHSHIDMNWLWPYSETVDVCRRDFSSMLSLMDRYPEFKFSQSQAATYRDMEREYPEIFKGIANAIAAGKWDVTAGEWVENDLNMSGSEALARQFLYANRYMSEQFNTTSKVCWCPDTFGHPANIPQVLKQAGIEYYYHCRAGNGKPLSQWEGIDGSTVLATHDIYGYGGDVMPVMLIQCLKHFVSNLHIPLAYWVYGVGDHGGAATAIDIEHARIINEAPLMPSLVCSTAQQFFDEAQKHALSLPAHKGEMNTVFEGCYSSHADIKLMNRSSENALISAEAISASSSALLGTRYPQGDISEAWRITNFHQFHDILCGCSIGVTYDEASQKHAMVKKIADRTVADALSSLAAATDTNFGEGSKVVVFNQLAWTRTDVVTMDASDVSIKAAAMLDDTGKLTPVQYSDGKLYFIAHDVPSMGSRVYTPVEQADATTSIAADSKALCVENDYMRLAVHPVSGAICNLLHKPSGRDLAATGGGWGPEANSISGLLNRLQVLYEQPHGMSAWNIGDITRVDNLITGATVSVDEVGPVFATVTINRSILNSSMNQKLRIYDGLQRVDFITSIDWHEQGTASTDAPMLKASFTPVIGSSTATFETPFAPVVRTANGGESPALRWADIGDGEFGVSLMNNCKYGYSAQGNTLSLTLVRSSYEPDNHPDEGQHELIYSIYPYAGTWQSAGADRRAAELNQPMITTTTSAHGGKVTTNTPLIEISDAGIMVSTLKLAEVQPDHHVAYILRMYEAHGQNTTCSINMNWPVDSVHISNIVEKILDPVGVENGQVTLSFKPHEIITLLINKKY